MHEIGNSTTRWGSFAVIPNGVDPKWLEYSDSGLEARTTGRDGPILLTVARIHPSKGLDTLISAMKILTEKVRGITLVVVGPPGDQGYESMLRHRVKVLGLEQFVQFAGQVPHRDMPSFYSRCDVFVLPSIHESQPIALLEAMAFGRPVVATDLPGVREILEQGKAGILVPPGDPARLADAIGRILTDERLALQLGQAGRSIARTRDWNRIAMDLEEFYWRVLLSQG